MLWSPQKGVRRLEHNTGAVGTATPGTSVTTGGTSSTKGTAVQLIASTAFDAYWVKVVASSYGLAATASEGALDILIGAATEEVLIPNLLMGGCGSIAAAGNGPKCWDFPLYIPAGSRLAAQAAGARVSTAMRVAIYLYGGDGYPAFRVGSKVTTYGMGTVPNGTTITPGASGAEGSWTQITSSTSEDHFAFVPSFQCNADTTMNLRQFMVDIGTGAATEEMIAEGYWFATDNGELMGGPYNSMPCMTDVPSGTRLVMRVSNSGANDSGYNGVIHAVS
jgi:hypothetical protein